MEVWGSIPNGGAMEIKKNIYEKRYNWQLEGTYQLFKYKGEYWWGYIRGSLNHKAPHEKLYIREGRRIDTYIDLGGFDYAFKFEDGDI